MLKSTHRSVVGACAVLLIFGWTSWATPLHARVLTAAQEGTGDSSKNARGNVDRAVEYPMAKVLAAAKQALLAYGCESKAKRERPDYVECTTARHVGVFVGSGGEKMTVQLSPQGDETRVVIKTGKGFAGRLGKKNWSTEVFDEMMKTLQTQ